MARVEIPEKPPAMTARGVAKMRRDRRMSPRETVEEALSAIALVWGDGELGELNGLAVTSAILDEMIRTKVAEARGAGYSWSEVGAALGMTKQAAQQKYRSVVKVD